MSEEQDPIFLRPEEAARRLGVNVKVLSYMRRMGKIEGTRFGNFTLYTEKQIKNADLRKGKPGPKAGEGSRRGRARYTWAEDEGIKKEEGSNNNTLFPPRWRICESQPVSPNALLVGV